MNTGFLSLSAEPFDNKNIFLKCLSSPVFQLLIIILLSLLLYSVHVGEGGLMSLDECYYAQKAKEMVRDGHWLIPHFAGKPYYDNPPFHMWIIAASYSVFGVSEWAARFPTVLEAVAVLVLTYFLARWLFEKNRWLPFIACMCLLFADYFFKYSKKCHMDILMTLFFLILVISFIAGKRRHPAWFLLMGGAVGCAILTKSVLGLFSPIVIFVYILIAGEWDIFKKPLFWVAMVLAVIIGASWYAYAWLSSPDHFYNEHIRYLLVSRSLAGSEEKSIAYMFFSMFDTFNKFLSDVHIWFLMMIPGVVFYFIDRKKKAESLTIKKEQLLLLVWFVVPLGIMLFAKNSFSSWYLMPLFVPMVIYTAYFLLRVFKTEKGQRTVAVAFLGVNVLLLLFFIVGPFFSYDMKHDIRNPDIRRLGDKVRRLDPPVYHEVVVFPSTVERGTRYNVPRTFDYYWGIAQQWTFYSDTVINQHDGVSPESVYLFISQDNRICLTTEEGLNALRKHIDAPIEVISRVNSKDGILLLCTTAGNYQQWKDAATMIDARAPLYNMPDY